MRSPGFLLLFALAASLVRGEVGLLGMVQFTPLLPSSSFFPKTFRTRKVIPHFISHRSIFLEVHGLKVLQVRSINTFFKFLLLPLFFFLHSFVFNAKIFQISHKCTRCLLKILIWDLSPESEHVYYLGAKNEFCFLCLVVSCFVNKGCCYLLFWPWQCTTEIG